MDFLQFHSEKSESFHIVYMVGVSNLHWRCCKQTCIRINCSLLLCARFHSRNCADLRATWKTPICIACIQTYGCVWLVVFAIKHHTHTRANTLQLRIVNIFGAIDERQRQAYQLDCANEIRHSRRMLFFLSVQSNFVIWQNIVVAWAWSKSCWMQYGHTPRKFHCFFFLAIFQGIRIGRSVYFIRYDDD